MAVYTEVSQAEASKLLSSLQLGTLISMEGCMGGIENTNYFVTTDQAPYVLTVFERLGFEQLPFYLRLMKHLALHGIPVPDPAADSDGDVLHTLQGKPAAVVNRLRGKSELAPSAEHCAQVGAMLARMHLAGQSFGMEQPNLRGLSWWNETIPVVLPHLTAEQAQLISAELAYQNHVAASSDYTALPRGPIHADLFRDNVMFETVDGQPTLSGFFDFYFAGVDTCLFDLAVCLNDWCIDLPTGMTDLPRSQAFVHAYESVRPLTAAERRLLPAMLRAGALRFWTSRLWDWFLPREASMLKPHDPTHFERVLRHRSQQPLTMDALATTTTQATATPSETTV
ncbi:homoserine kinase [Curvibacter sp. CHRR-16]|uniref:homoserine kinase n=1 Tax=Curvibacter sp. CHRR-16 TaxID=2835872 RepID=UPI001BDA0435|nr:homoserine kinase [Curvibacter sp. CHRR-16]MBT0570819.1 homoserine kinase [Curvibacter sp. CHRR-16]